MTSENEKENENKNEKRRKLHDKQEEEEEGEKSSLHPVVAIFPRMSVYNNIISDVQFQYSTHQVPRLLRRECKIIFPHVNNLDQLISVITFQRATVDLVEYTSEAEYEKNKLLETFVKFSLAVCNDLKAEGHWADYIDPCSGYPGIGDRGSSGYNEVDGVTMMLKYSTVQAGGCRVLLHPEWGTRCYPASFFTTAPMEVLTTILSRIHTAFAHPPPEKDIHDRTSKLKEELNDNNNHHDHKNENGNGKREDNNNHQNHDHKNENGNGKRVDSPVEESHKE